MAISHISRSQRSWRLSVPTRALLVGGTMLASVLVGWGVSSSSWPLPLSATELSVLVIGGVLVLRFPFVAVLATFIVMFFNRVIEPLVPFPNQMGTMMTLGLTALAFVHRLSSQRSPARPKVRDGSIDPLNVSIVLLLGYGLVMMLPGPSWAMAYSEYGQLARMFLLFWAVRELNFEWSQARTLLAVLVGATTLSVVYGVYQYVLYRTSGIFAVDVVSRWLISMGNPNANVVNLVTDAISYSEASGIVRRIGSLFGAGSSFGFTLVVPFCVALVWLGRSLVTRSVREKTFWTVLFGLIVWNLMTSHTRSAWIALALAALVYLRLMGRSRASLVVLSLLFSAAILLVMLQDPELTRTTLWRFIEAFSPSSVGVETTNIHWTDGLRALRESLDAPLGRGWGWGRATVQYYRDLGYSGLSYYDWNETLYGHLIRAIGLPGIFLFGVVFYLLGRELWQAYGDAQGEFQKQLTLSMILSWVAIMVVNFFFPAFNWQMQVAFFPLVAICLSRRGDATRAVVERDSRAE